VAVSSFQRLDPTAVQATVDRLVMRIARRFPDRNLGRVAAELSGLVTEVTVQSSADRRRKRAIDLACRIAGIAIVAVAIAAIILAIHDALPESGDVRGFQWLSVLESGIADLVYAAIAVYFLMSLQERFHGTDATITFTLDAAELANYLDYCTEILSLVAKTAALCAEESTDSVVLDTVSEVETLAVGLAREIWQKISLLRAD
jgi:hypothetical protein